MSYDKSAPVLEAVTQEIALNREGLVADCIFPKVQTGCNFAYIDWTGELKDLKSINDHVTCKTDANEIDTGDLKLKHGGTQDHALMQSLEECCVTVCGVSNLDEKIAAQKTRALTNKLLIGREERAIRLATDVTKYTDNNALAPSDEGAVVDGGLFKLAKTNFDDPNFASLRYFQSINENALFGQRNVMITDLATLNGLMTHPQFIGSGCVVDPMTSMDKVASLLGLSKICIADGKYNDGLGEQVSIKKLWPKNTILFTSSYEFITSTDPQLAFGITAYSQDLTPHQFIDEKKGKGAGAMMQKIGHDLTEVVLSYKAATLVKLTA